MGLFWVNLCFLFISVGSWLVGLLFGPIILVGFGMIYLLNLVLGLTLLFWHYVESEKSKMRAIGWLKQGMGMSRKLVEPDLR